MKKIVLVIIALLWANVAFAQTLTTPWTSTPPIGPGGNVMLGPSGGATSVAVWTPLNDLNLIAWWDAQNIPSLTLSGSNVSAWADRKGGLVASQATGANQPVWSASARNGKAGVTFNGTTTFLSGNSSTLPSGSSPSSIYVAGFLNSAAVTEFAFTYGNASSLNWRVVFNAATTGNIGGGLFSGDISSSTVWLNNDRFVGYLIGAASQQLFGDGSSIGSSSFVPNTTAASTFFIGKQVNPGNFSGPIQQIVITNNVSSTNERQCIEGWESWYDGKAGVNLPTANPYSATGTLNRAPLVTDNCT